MVQMFPFVIKASSRRRSARTSASPSCRSRGPLRAGRRQLVPQLGDPEERGQPGRRMGVHQDGDGQEGRRGLARERRRAAHEQGRGRGHQGSVAKFFLKLSANPQVPLLDSVVPLKVALLYYQQLQAAFSGKIDAAARRCRTCEKGLEDAEPLTASHDTRRVARAGPIGRAVAVGPRSTRRPPWRSWACSSPIRSRASLYHSLTRWDGIGPSQWVGLHNFRCSGATRSSALALRNNAIFALSVPIQSSCR